MCLVGQAASERLISSMQVLLGRLQEERVAVEQSPAFRCGLHWLETTAIRKEIPQW
jgi:hypothetical protein